MLGFIPFILSILKLCVKKLPKYLLNGCLHIWAISAFHGFHMRDFQLPRFKCQSPNKRVWTPVSRVHTLGISAQSTHGCYSSVHKTNKRTRTPFSRAHTLWVNAQSIHDCYSLSTSHYVSNCRAIPTSGHTPHLSVCRWWFTTWLTQFTDNKACSRAASLQLNFWITHIKYTNKFLFCRVMPYEIILIPRGDCLLGKGNLASGVSTTALLPSMRSTRQCETGTCREKRSMKATLKSQRK